jgi:hypothetical protein
MTSTLGTVAETTEIMTEVDVHDNPDERPVRMKRTMSERLKTGRASTHLWSLTRRPNGRVCSSPLPPKLAPPPPPAGRNASCMSTNPGENQRPSAWSGVDHGGEWAPHEYPYDQQFAGDAQYGDLWRRDSFRCPAPPHDDRRWDEHTPLLYNYQPSSPFQSLLHMPLRGLSKDAFEGRQQASTSGLHFQDFSAFRDAVQQEIQRVSLSFR